MAGQLQIKQLMHYLLDSQTGLLTKPIDTGRLITQAAPERTFRCGLSQAFCGSQCSLERQLQYIQHILHRLDQSPLIMRLRCGN